MKKNGATIPSFDVLQQAAEWYALLGSSTVTDADLTRWQEWHVADDTHQFAWARVEAISKQFTIVPASERQHVRITLTTATQRQITRRRAMNMLALLCGAGGTIWLGASVSPWQAWTATYRTTTGELRQAQLADGTTLWINTASAVDVDYDTKFRRLTLYQGEIMIKTATDNIQPARALIVDSKGGRLRALGTRFTVRTYDDYTDIAVFEGAVEITPANKAIPPYIVETGQQVRLSAQNIAQPASADNAAQAWTTGTLVADNMRLETFIAELSRYRRGYLACTPEVANLRIVGTYALADTDQILGALAATLPIKIQKTTPWWVVISAQH